MKRLLFLSAALLLVALSYWLGTQKGLTGAMGTMFDYAATEIGPTKQGKVNSEVDPIAEIGLRSPLSPEQAISMLTNWTQSPNTLIQQFPLYDAVARAPISDFNILSEFFATLPPKIKYEADHVLELRWLKEAPFELAQQYYQRADQDLDKWNFNKKHVIQSMAKHSFEETLAFVRSREDEGLDVSIEYAALLAFATENGHTEYIDFLAANVPASPNPQSEEPEITIEHLRQLIADEANPEYPENLIKGLRTLAKTDARSALELASNIQNNGQYTETISSILNLYSQSEPQEAFAAIAQYFKSPEFSRQKYNLSNSLRNVLNQSPDSILNWLQNQPDTQKANQDLTMLLRYTDCNNLDALDVINVLPRSQQKLEIIQNSITNIAMNDWYGSTRWIEQNMSEEEADRVKPGLMVAAYKQGIPIALEFFESMTQSQSKLHMAQTLADQWGRDDFDSALDWAMNLENPMIQNAALQNLSSRWIRKDPESARSFAEKSTDPNLRTQFLQQFAEVDLSSSAPETILQNLDRYQEASIKRNAMERAIQEIAVSDPVRAMNLLTSLESEEASMVAMATKNLAQQWSRVDPSAAAQNLWSQGGSIAQSSLGAVLSSLAETDENLAIERLDLLPTEELRQQAYLVVLRNGYQYERFTSLTSFAREHSNQSNDAPINPVFEHGW